jgi:hypothetical protein
MFPSKVSQNLRAAHNQRELLAPRYCTQPVRSCAVVHIKVRSHQDASIVIVSILPHHRNHHRHRIQRAT